MIQDIRPYKLDNHFDPMIRPDENSLVLVFNGKEMLIKLDTDAKTLQYPAVSEFMSIDKDSLIYLFCFEDEKFFLLQDDSFSISPDYSFHGIHELRSDYFEPKRYVFAANTAYQLSEWYTVTSFCGRCGSRNEYHSSERARICPKCGNIIYPRINPAVIIGVTDKATNRLVLTKYRTGFAHNALVAGFTEIGETLEETVEREVMEEVGLKVTNIRYYKSQPWGIASDILAGFYCDVIGNPAIKMDVSELKYAQWVSPDDIILQPIDYSLTNEMMRLFKEHGYEGTL